MFKRLGVFQGTYFFYGKSDASQAAYQKDGSNKHFRTVSVYVFSTIADSYYFVAFYTQWCRGVGKGSYCNRYGRYLGLSLKKAFLKTISAMENVEGR